MIIRLFLIFFSIFVTGCGFSPIYSGNLKNITISKSEIVGEKNLIFDLEKKLNFTKDEKSPNSYVFKAQIFDSNETSVVDSRGIPTEEIIRLTVTYQFEDKNNIVVYQDSIAKEKRVSVTDNISNNILVKNNEKKLLLDTVVQNILFKTRVVLK